MKHWLRRLFPAPVLSLALLGFWLLLNQSLSGGHLVLGVILGVLGPVLTDSLRPRHPVIRHPWAMVGVLSYFIYDMIKSNWKVALIILQRSRTIESGLVTVPLYLRDPHGLILLAIMISSSPGTAWAQISEDRSELTLHLLDLNDRDEALEIIRERYEKPLQRIFDSHLSDVGPAREQGS